MVDGLSLLRSVVDGLSLLRRGELVCYVISPLFGRGGSRGSETYRRRVGPEGAIYGLSQAAVVMRVAVYG